MNNYEPEAIEPVPQPSQSISKVLQGTLEGVNLLNGDIRIGGNGKAGELIVTDENNIPTVYIGKQKMRVALPGYNVLTDTNPDHFSLITDIENVMVKEKARGAFTRGFGTQTIAHNLGYIPYFLVYVKDNTDAFSRFGWKLVGNQNSAFVAANYTAYADDTNIYVNNNTGTTTDFYYFIFYDDQVAGSTTFTPSGRGIYISKAGADAFSRNPNDFIFHSDLNTFKIIEESNSSISFTTGAGTENSGVFTPATTPQNPVPFMIFVKFPGTDMASLSTGAAPAVSYDGAWGVIDSLYKSDNKIEYRIARYTGVGTETIYRKMYLFESIIAGDPGFTVNHALNKVKVSKSGIDATNGLKPNDFNFLSGYNTLKYFMSFSHQITIVGDGTHKVSSHTMPHNLGYYPFFVAYVDDFVSAPGDQFAIAPYYNETLTTERKAFAYCDEHNIYLQFINRSMNTYTATFWVKVYLNNLGF